MPSTIPWSEIRFAYESGEETVREIAERFAIGETTLWRRRKKDGWTLRRPSRSGGKHKTRPAPADIADRLKALLRSQIAEIEKEMRARPGKNAAVADPAHRERAARTLTSLVRAYERLLALTIKDGASDPKREGETGLRNRDDLRQELHRRLGRIAAAANSKKLSGKPQR